MSRYLVTGGAGFIGSNFIRHLLARDPDARVTNLDLLTYAGVESTVAELDENARHSFVRGDIRDETLVGDVMVGHDVVVNFAAESHVDRSIATPRPFIETNVLGTAVLIDAARRNAVPTFVQVSTDEVYGSLPSGSAREDAVLAPSSPYSASKAGADLLVRSYGVTFDYPAIVTRCTNNYGPYQFPEKVIPRFITNLLEGMTVPVFGTGEQERDWLHVEDHCAALLLLIAQGTPGEVYNIGANQPLANIDLARAIVGILGRDESSIEFVSDRPGHDARYAVDSTKLRNLGWMPRNDFGDRLADTVDWYQRREDWWSPLKACP